MRHTRLLTGAGGAIVRTFMRLWLLPFEAWVSAAAILTVLWRMLISHRKLLQWQTFAQTSGGEQLGEKRPCNVGVRCDGRAAHGLFPGDNRQERGLHVAALPGGRGSTGASCL